MSVEERRTERRVRALKGGHIVFNHSASVIDCRIRNLSPHGALLEVASVVGVPDRFELRFEDGARRRCAVRRRSATQLGVVFED